MRVDAAEQAVNVPVQQRDRPRTGKTVHIVLERDLRLNGFPKVLGKPV